MSRLTLRRDDRFARLLELPASAAGTAEEAMSPLVAMANALRAAGYATAPATTPDGDFRAALRQRLVAVATVQGVEPAPVRLRAAAAVRSRHRLQQRVVALAGTVAIASSIAGVGVAAARSLPGDPFYDVKRATEAVQLWTARGDAAKGKRHLEFARTRLAEARALSPNSSHLTSTLTAMDSQTMAGTRELISAYNSSKSLSPLTELVTFTAQQIAGLRALAPTLPAPVRSQDAKSIQLLTGVTNQAHAVSNGICLTCTGSSGNSSPNGGPTAPGSSSSSRPNQSGGSGTPGSGSASPRTSPSGSATSPVQPRQTPSLPITVPTLPTKLPSLPIALPTATTHHTKKPHPLKSPLPIISTLLHHLL